MTILKNAGIRKIIALAVIFGRVIYSLKNSITHSYGVMLLIPACGFTVL